MFLLKSMRISLHLSAFSSILFSIDHASTAETALCTSLVKPRGIVWAIVVSSTYFQVSASTSRSLIINKNNQGPSLVPCGTPAGTRPHSDRKPDDSLTRCFLSHRKSSTQTQTHRGKAYFVEKQAKKKISIFDQSHGLTPLKNICIGRLGKILIFQSR